MQLHWQIKHAPRGMFEVLLCEPLEGGGKRIWLKSATPAWSVEQARQEINELNDGLREVVGGDIRVEGRIW